MCTNFATTAIGDKYGDSEGQRATHTLILTNKHALSHTHVVKRAYFCPSTLSHTDTFTGSYSHTHTHSPPHTLPLPFTHTPSHTHARSRACL